MTRLRRSVNWTRRAPSRFWRWFTGSAPPLPEGHRDPRVIERSEIESSFDAGARTYLRELADKRLKSQTDLVDAIDGKAYVMFGLATVLIGGASIFGGLRQI